MASVAVGSSPIAHPISLPKARERSSDLRGNRRQSKAGTWVFSVTDPSQPRMASSFGGSRCPGSRNRRFSARLLRRTRYNSCVMKPKALFAALVLIIFCGQLSAARIVYPQAAVGPLAGDEFQIELHLANRDPNVPWHGTLRFLRGQDLGAAADLTVRVPPNDPTEMGDSLAVELPPSGSQSYYLSSPGQLVVGVLVIESETAAPENLVASFFYRLLANGQGKDLIAIQPSRAPGLAYSVSLTRRSGLDVGLALVADEAIERAIQGLSIPATEVTLTFTPPSGPPLVRQIELGDANPPHTAVFPSQLFAPDFPAEVDSGRLDLHASRPVHVTLLAVGTEPLFEDVQIGATPAEAAAWELFRLPAGASFPGGGDNLLAGHFWPCSSSALQEVPGGLVGATTGSWATVIHTQGPSLEIPGDFNLTAALHVGEGYQGSLMLVGRPPTGPFWYQGARLDVGITEAGAVNVTAFNNDPSPVPEINGEWVVDPPLAGKTVVEVSRRGDRLTITANGRPVTEVQDSFGLLEDGRLWLGLNLPPRSRFALYGLAAVVPQGGAVSLRPSPFRQRQEIPEESLRTLAGAHNLKVGAAVAPNFISDEADYRRILGGQFNMLTAENVMKWGPIHPEPDRFNFCPADALVEFAQANGMAVRGHTLVWHNQLPSWVTSSQFTRDELLAVMRRHIQTIVGRYRGKIQHWDVVNEALDDAPGNPLRNTVFLNTIGPEYIDWAFRWAHEADPDAKLFYNDYGIEDRGSKSDRSYELVQGLKERGVPIDGVGFQFHLRLPYVPSKERIKQNFARFTELGLEVAVTELDVGIPTSNGITAQELANQAEVYRNVLEACLETEGCTTFVMWGFTDKHTWIPGFTQGEYDAPLPWNENYEPKPAYFALLEALRSP